MNPQDRVIMFVDMVGSTELKYREGTTTVSVLIQKLFQMVHRLAPKGLLVKFTGDGAMVVFRGDQEGCRDAL